MFLTFGARQRSASLDGPMRKVAQPRPAHGSTRGEHVLPCFRKKEEPARRSASGSGGASAKRSGSPFVSDEARNRAIAALQRVRSVSPGVLTLKLPQQPHAAQWRSDSVPRPAPDAAPQRPVTRGRRATTERAERLVRNAMPQRSRTMPAKPALRSRSASVSRGGSTAPALGCMRGRARSGSVPAVSCGRSGSVGARHASASAGSAARGPRAGSKTRGAANPIKSLVNARTELQRPARAKAAPAIKAQGGAGARQGVRARAASTSAGGGRALAAPQKRAALWEVRQRESEQQVKQLEDALRQMADENVKLRNALLAKGREPAAAPAGQDAIPQPRFSQSTAASEVDPRRRLLSESSERDRLSPAPHISPGGRSRSTPRAALSRERLEGPKPAWNAVAHVAPQEPLPRATRWAIDQPFDCELPQRDSVCEPTHPPYTHELLDGERSRSASRASSREDAQPRTSVGTTRSSTGLSKRLPFAIDSQREEGSAAVSAPAAAAPCDADTTLATLISCVTSEAEASSERRSCRTRSESLGSLSSSVSDLDSTISGTIDFSAARSVCTPGVTDTERHLKKASDAAAGARVPLQPLRQNTHGLSPNPKAIPSIAVTQATPIRTLVGTDPDAFYAAVTRSSVSPLPQGRQGGHVQAHSSYTVAFAIDSPELF